MAAENGKVEFGARNGRIFALRGGAKLLIIASNCPPELREDLKQLTAKSGVPVYFSELTSLEMGSVCGRPFPISVLSVIDAGNSEVLALAEVSAKPE